MQRFSVSFQFYASKENTIKLDVAYCLEMTILLIEVEDAPQRKRYQLRPKAICNGILHHNSPLTKVGSRPPGNHFNLQEGNNVKGLNKMISFKNDGN